MPNSHSSVTQAGTSMAPQLEVIQGEGVGQFHRVKMTTRVGRETDNDVVLTDTKASRHHAEISLERGQWVIRDLGSYNQTKVNDTAISEPVALTHGDTISIGESSFIFRLPQYDKSPAPQQSVVGATPPQRSNAMFPLIVGAFLVLLIAAIAVVFYATFRQPVAVTEKGYDTPVAEATPVKAESRPAEVTVTALPLFEPANLSLAYQDDFSDSKSGWDDASDKYTRKVYGNNRYQIEVNTANLVAWGLANRDVADFEAEVEARLEDGGKNNSYGLIFRFLDKENFYRFDISNDGYFLLTKFIQGKWITLIDWTASEQVKPNEANLLKVAAFGNNLSVWSNNQLLASVTDDSLTHGNFGFFAGTFGDTYLWVSFDNLKLSVPTGQEKNIPIIPTPTKVFGPLASAPTAAPVIPTMTPTLPSMAVVTETALAAIEATAMPEATEAITSTSTPAATNTLTSSVVSASTAMSATVTETVVLAPTPLPLPAYVSRDQPLARGQKLAIGRIIFPMFDPAKGIYNIYMADAADGGNQTLLQASASQPAVSPDGHDFSYRSWQPDKRGLFARPFKGGDEPWHFATFMEDSRPAVSPKSKTLLYYSNVGGREPAIYWVTNGVAEVMRRDGSPIQGEGAKWINEKEFVYKSCIGGTCGIMLGDTVGGGGKLLTDNVTDRNPETSPDGSVILFMSQRSGNWDIYRMDLAGQNIQALTDDKADDGLPTWSADGKHIAFASNRDGEWSIWEMDPDGKSQRRLFALENSIDGVIQHDPNNSRGWTDENIVWLDESK